MGYSNGDIVRIINEDCTGRKIMRKTANADDPESIKDAFNAVIEKYGLDIKIINSSRKAKSAKMMQHSESDWRW